MFIYTNDLHAECVTYGMFISDDTNLIHDTPAMVQSTDHHESGIIVVSFMNGMTRVLHRGATVKEFEEA